MEYFFSFLLFLFFWNLTTWSAVLFGQFLTSGFIVIAIFLGLDYPIIGIGGLIGNLLNIYIVSKFINQKGVMSKAPANGIYASKWYMSVFLLCFLLKYFNLPNEEYPYWYFYFVIIGYWLLINIFKFFKKDNSITIDAYFDSVIKYKIVEKYVDDPKWATYLYFKDGGEDWNKTIKGSYRAKHPSQDLTFVFSTEKEAMDYAQFNFENGKNLQD